MLTQAVKDVENLAEDEDTESIEPLIPPNASAASIWTFAYYQSYFDIDTDEASSSCD